MKTKTTILLAAVLVAVMLYVVIRKATQTDRPVTDANAPRLVLGTEIDDIRTITIRGEARPLRRLAYAEGRWRIVEPVDAPAVSWKIEQLTDQLGELRYLSEYGPDDELPPDVTGLASPAWTVEFTDGAGKTYTLLVGRRIALPGGGDQTYVQPAGSDRVYAVRADLARTLSAPVGELRSKEVLAFDVQRVQAIQLRTDDTVALARDGGDWAITAPVAARAERKKVEDLLGQLDGLTAQRFVADEPDSLTPYGLETPSAVVTIRMMGHADPNDPNAPPTPGETYQLALGRTLQEATYAQRLDQPAVFTLSQETAEKLTPEMSALRDPRITRFTPARARRVELTTPTGAVILERQQGQWQMLEPLAGEADANQVSETLTAVSELEADTWRDQPGRLDVFGLAEPAGVIRVFLFGRDDPIELRLGGKSPSGQMAFVQLAGASTVAAVPAEKLTDLPRGPAAYRSPQLLTTPLQARLRELGIARPEATVRLARGETGEWRMTHPVEAALRPEAVRAIINRLDDLRADEVISLTGPPVEPGKADAAVAIEATWHLPPETETPPTAGAADANAAHASPTDANAPAETGEEESDPPRTLRRTIHFVRVGNEIHGWVAGDGAEIVGAFPPEVWDEVTAELRDGQVLRFDPAGVSAIRLTGPDAGLDLRRQDDKWTDAGDPFVEIDPEKVGDYLDSLSSIRARRFIRHESAGLAEFGLAEPAITLSLTAGERTETLAISARSNETGRYAVVEGVPGVFTLSGKDVEKVTATLSELKQD